MDVSVVVPTLNDCDELRSCLDALASEAAAEIIVVNGPSTDGTTGMVRDHPDVDVLVEIDDRNVNVARNAGLDRASGDVIAFVDPTIAVEGEWLEAVTETLADADAVTGPTHEQLHAGVATETVESRTICGRSVTYFNGGNAAFSREVLEMMDGFDEALDIGGARDGAHRLAGLGYGVAWSPEMCVSREAATDGGKKTRDWQVRYTALVYRLAKNYGVHPTVIFRTVRHAVTDGATTLRDVARGDAKPTTWLGNGRDVVVGSIRGFKDGLRARYADRTPRRNPNGWSGRTDRAVTVYDRR